MQMKTTCPQMLQAGAVSLLITASALSDVRADAVTDWNERAGEIVVKARLGPLPAERALAMVQASVYEAVNAITQRYPVSDLKLEAAAGASVEAAVATASHAMLTKLIPSQQAVIDRAYEAALTAIVDGPAQTSGIAVAERAVMSILARRTNDGAAAGGSYCPYTRVATYVPMVIPEGPQWRYRKPWLMTDPAQFRPGSPPGLESELWAHDYNEVKALGGKYNQQRTAEQTEISCFWEEVMPPIYHAYPAICCECSRKRHYAERAPICRGYRSCR